MPNTLVNIVGSCAVSDFCCVSTNGIVPFLSLEEPDSAGEQTGCDDVQQTGRGNEEDLKFRSRTAPVARKGLANAARYAGV